MYPVEDVVLPNVEPNDLDDIPTVGLEFARARKSDLEKIQSSGQYRQAVQAYLASITYADAQIGRVLDALESSGVEGETIVVLWSDHGWHLGEKGHWHKTTLWEEATRIPLVIDAPGYASGRCERPVSLLDLYPTLTDLCPRINGSRPELDGLSLRPLLQNPEAIWRRPALIQYKRGNVAVRSERFRYIQYSDGGEELYDHSKDPYEWDNLASDPKLKSMKAQLKQWVPEQWAKSAKKKSAFDFDPKSYSWTNKATGEVILGK